MMLSTPKILWLGGLSLSLLLIAGGRPAIVTRDVAQSKVAPSEVRPGFSSERSLWAMLTAGGGAATVSAQSGHSNVGRDGSDGAAEMSTYLHLHDTWMVGDLLQGAARVQACVE